MTTQSLEFWTRRQTGASDAPVWCGCAHSEPGVVVPTWCGVVVPTWCAFIVFRRFACVLNESNGLIQLLGIVFLRYPKIAAPSHTHLAAAEAAAAAAGAAAAATALFILFCLCSICSRYTFWVVRIGSSVFGGVRRVTLWQPLSIPLLR